MPARDGMLLFIFSVIVALCHQWNLAGLQAVPPDWMSAIGLLGAFGLSAVLVSLLARVWRRLAASRAGSLRHSGAPPTAALAPSSLPASSEEAETVSLLRESGLFDADWYLGSNPDVVAAGLDPVEHYLHEGAAEGRNPNPFFDTAWYLDHCPDVRGTGINPLVHYILDGASEGRPAGPRFDTAFYRSHNDDVVESRMNPLAHYLHHGRFEGRLAFSETGA